MAGDGEEQQNLSAAGSPASPTERALKDRVEQLISKIRPAVHSEKRRHSIFFYVDQLIRRCFHPEEVCAPSGSRCWCPGSGTPSAQPMGAVIAAQRLPLANLSRVAEPHTSTQLLEAGH